MVHSSLRETLTGTGRESSEVLDDNLSGDVMRTFEQMMTCDDSEIDGDNGSSSRLGVLVGSLGSTQDLFAHDSTEFVRAMIEREFPKNYNPSLRDIIHVGPQPRGSPYRSGEWVEIRNRTMEWELQMITRVTKESPSDWNGNDPANRGKTPPWK